MLWSPRFLLVVALLPAGLSDSPAQAQIPSRPITQHIVDLWQEESGLPQNNVSAILQTRDGYIWVGTQAGLGRFDGVRFTTYDDRQPGQLRDSEVWALAEDTQGALWVGTYGGGLSCLEHGTFTTYTTAEGLPSDQVTALAPDPDGSLWVGTTAGLARLQHGRFARYGANDGLAGGPVRALYADRHAVLWIGTDEGLSSYSAGRFVNHTLAHPGQLAGQVSAISGDAESGLWLAFRPPGTSGDGLRYMKDGAISAYTTRDGLPSNIVMSIVTLQDRTVWVGTREGLSRYAGGRFEAYFSDVWGATSQQMLERASMQGIPALAADREGNLWFGTRLNGLGRLREGLFLNLTGGDTTGQGIDVRAILGDRAGNVWVGTSHDLRRFGGNVVESYRYGAPSGSAADALAVDGDGTLLVGSQDGLSRWRSGRIEPFPLEAARSLKISLLFTDARKRVWIGTRDNGVYRVSDRALIPLTSKEGLLGGQVRGLGEDSRGGIWVGTRDGGVTYLRPSADPGRSGPGGLPEQQVTTFGPQQGLSSPAVQALLVDREDTVWVATRRGLNRIRDNRVARIDASYGLPANYFYQIVDDGLGHLWMTYARGIARVAKADINAVADGRAASVTPMLFGVHSGMKSTAMTLAHQPSVWQASDGRLWFATARGVEVLDPRDTIRNAVPPPVHVEELRVDRKLLPLSDPMTLQPTRGEIEIRYTGLSFVAPNRVLFKYLLEGYDRDWIDAGTRRVTYYSNLPHGRYRFRVIACNNDGIWNNLGASVSLEVLPRWHERAWIRALGIALLGCFAFGFHRSRVAGLRARERELAARVKERTHALHELTSTLEQRVSTRTAELEGANQALLAERERLAVTLASIGDGVMATDVESHVVLMNLVAERITGWTAAEASGRALGDVFRTIDRRTREPLPDPSLVVLERGMAAGTMQPCVLLARDGREVVVADSVAPIRDPHSHIVGAVLVFRDITDRERIDEQLRNTQRLEALGGLAGGIAHDFNNLLTGIFGFVDIARDRASEPDHVRDTMQRAAAVLEKARGLTRQLLTFSKAGEPVRKPVDLGPLVRNAVSFALSGSNVVGDCRVPAELWPCEVDEQQIDQVVDNLVLNARQAMPSGGTVVVELANAQLPDDVALGRAAGPYVRLSVRDQGPGIPREIRPKIFEPFFTTKERGTGLGLATVYSIVRRHGGYIKIESEEGQGAVFEIVLRASPGAVTTVAPAAPTPSGGGAGRKAGRILVMDDEEYVRDVAGQVLKRIGYSVILAADDREAVALLRQAVERGERVDAAILDMTIPGGLGGAEALQRLREVVPDLRAIASTGYSGDAVMAYPAEQGFDAALPKPYTIATVRAVVERVLEK
jgi:PAS domain S-box-containing protein